MSAMSINPRKWSITSTVFSAAPSAWIIVCTTVIVVLQPLQISISNNSRGVSRFRINYIKSNKDSPHRYIGRYIYFFYWHLTNILKTISHQNCYYIFQSFSNRIHATISYHWNTLFISLWSRGALDLKNIHTKHTIIKRWAYSV